MEADEDPTANYHHEYNDDHDMIPPEETHHHEHDEMGEEHFDHHDASIVHLEFLDRQPTKEEIWEVSYCGRIFRNFCLAYKFWQVCLTTRAIMANKTKTRDRFHQGIFGVHFSPFACSCLQMKRATKRPSEWLKLLCKDWAEENMQLVESTDHKFLEYKPYLKGFLSSQLLCRLCIPSGNNGSGRSKEDGSNASAHSNPPFDFWKMLDIQDEFDKAYIIAQVERFCALYHIRGGMEIPPSAPVLGFGPGTASGATPEAAAAAAAAAVAAASGHYLSPDATAAAVAAAQLAATNKAAGGATSPITTAAAAASRTPTAVSADAVTKAQRLARDAERALELERKHSVKRDQKRQLQDRKLEKQREREQLQIKKQAEKIAREQSREEKRKKKLELREQRERFAQEQKEAALKRAAELVASNRVPIEITRGAAAAKQAADRALKQLGANTGTTSPVCDPIKQEPATAATAPEQQQSDASPLSGPKKQRSAIVVSTASDLHQIVTHSKNLWAKYNAIAKEHNQRVNWVTVAKELGIHVKVREKYARMHSRAEQRGFDWKVHGHWKIKDHPEIFVEPTPQERKARMPPPPPDASRTVVIENYKPPQGQEPPEAADIGAEAAAAVVDATVVGTPNMATAAANTTSTTGTNHGYDVEDSSRVKSEQNEHPGGGQQGADGVMVL
jgi:hypothetical protein